MYVFCLVFVYREGRFAMYTIERGPVHPENSGRYLGQWAVTSLTYHTLL